MKLKLICLLMALAMVLPFALSCSDDKGDSTEPATTTAPAEPAEPAVPDVNETPDPNMLNVVWGGKTSYSIVYSANKMESNKLVAAAKELSEKIKNKTNVSIPVVTDAAAATEYEIIIGNTERSESVSVKDSLDAKSFAVKAVGNKIIIVGNTDSDTIDAVCYFMANFVNNINAEKKNFSLQKTLDILCGEDAETTQITVMGVPISQFTIVIPQNSLASEERLANYLVDKIEKISGEYLRIKNDTNEYDNEILIGNTERTASLPEGNVFSVSGNGGKLKLTAGSMFAYIELLDYVLKELFSERYDVLTITENFDYSRDITSTLADGSEYSMSREGEYRLLNQNIWGNGRADNHIVRHKMTLELCLAYNADVLCFQEFNPSNRTGGIKAFDALLEANGYVEVKPDSLCTTGASGATVYNASKNYTPVFYRADKFELIESDYYKFPGNNDSGSKSYTWAVLKDKETGDMFAALSTHFWYEGGTEGDLTRIDNASHVMEAVDYITGKYEGIAVLCGGDYNSNVNSGAIKSMLEDGFTSAAKTAKKRDNIRTHHGYPTYSSIFNTYTAPIKPTGDSNASIDHILIKNADSIELNLYEVSLDLYSLLTSDHCAMFVDFNVK